MEGRGGGEAQGVADPKQSFWKPPIFRHVLASGSVDQTVLLWDMSEGTIASTLTAHKEKIQALQWHPFEAQMLLTGCCDQ
jgi:WD40 repeat protein